MGAKDIMCVEIENKTEGLTLREYQEKAMSTCTESSHNVPYMLFNLQGEVGELSSKVAKAIRKGEATILDGQLRHPSTRWIDEDLEEALILEAGDIFWQLVGFCDVMGWDVECICQMNLDKLQARKNANTIIGDGDGVLDR